MTDFKKLENFLTQQLSGDLRTILITTDDNGNYQLFGKYVIIPTKGGYYKVVVNATEEYEFGTVKHAVAWCTFDQSKKYREAKRIKELDLKLCSMEVDIAIHKKMAKNAKDDSLKCIYITKLQEDGIKKKIMLREINSYINTSKMIQAQRFEQKKQPNFSHLR